MIELTKKTDNKLYFEAKSEGIGKITINAIDEGNVVKSKSIYYIVRPITLNLEYKDPKYNDDAVSLYKGDRFSINVFTNADRYEIAYDANILEIDKGEIDTSKGRENQSAELKVFALNPKETNIKVQALRNEKVIREKIFNVNIHDIVLDVTYEPIHVRINDPFSINVRTEGADSFNVVTDHSAKLKSLKDGDVTFVPTEPGIGNIKVQAIKNGIVEKEEDVSYEADDIFIDTIHGVLDIQKDKDFEFNIRTNADHWEVKYDIDSARLVTKEEDKITFTGIKEGNSVVSVEAWQKVDGKDTCIKRNSVPFTVDKEGQRYDFTVCKDGDFVSLFNTNLKNEDYIVYINSEKSMFDINYAKFKADDHIVIRRSESNLSTYFPLIKDTTYIKDFYTLPLVSNDGINPVKDFTSFFEETNIETVSNTLFKFNPQVTNFDSVFYNCDKLKYIPEGLFDYNVDALSFKSAFERCDLIPEIPFNIFDKLNNTIIDLSSCFARCKNIKGNLPELWKKFKDSRHDYCFSELTNADNYGVAQYYKWTD